MLLCSFGFVACWAIAQNSGVLSKQQPVIRIFDPDKNESTVLAILVDPQSSAARAMLGIDPDHSPPAIRLHRAEYNYPGKTQSRPQAIAFVFFPLHRYKSAPDYSIKVEGTVLSEGQTTFGEWCCSKVNGHNESQQQIMVAVPLDIFERIIQAGKVELKLISKSGKYSFKLNDYQKKSLKTLADTIN